MIGSAAVIVPICIISFVVSIAGVLAYTMREDLGLMSSSRKAWKNNTDSIPARIPFTLFRGSYAIEPKKWELRTYYAEYDGRKVGFQSYWDWKQYKKYREHLDEIDRMAKDLQKRMKAVEESAKIRDAIMRGYMPERDQDVGDVVAEKKQSPPPAPNTGSNAIKKQCTYCNIGSAAELSREDLQKMVPGSIARCADTGDTYWKTATGWTEFYNNVHNKTEDLVYAMLNSAQQAQTQSVLTGLQSAVRTYNGIPIVVHDRAWR